MTDSEIMAKINTQLQVAIALQIAGSCAERIDPADRDRIERLHRTANLFMAHALKLLATHRLAATRWFEMQPPQPQWIATLQ